MTDAEKQPDGMRISAIDPQLKFPPGRRRIRHPSGQTIGASASANSGSSLSHFQSFEHVNETEDHLVLICVPQFGERTQRLMNIVHSLKAMPSRRACCGIRRPARDVRQPRRQSWTGRWLAKINPMPARQRSRDRRPMYRAQRASRLGAPEDDHHSANWLPISERPFAVRPAHDNGWDLPSIVNSARRES